jgi:hypothetical protein
MKEILIFVFGAIGGFIIHSITMKVSFKQRTIDNKIKVFDSVIAHWVRMRNFIYSTPNTSPHTFSDFDKMYGESQAFIGEAILICENVKLTDDINKLNEKFYHTDWNALEHKKVNENMEEIKKEAIAIIARMREDIKNCTRFELSDFIHIFSGLKNKKENNF